MFGGFLFLLVLLVLVVALKAAAAPDSYSHEKDPVYWRNIAHEELETTLAEQYPGGVAKNIIIFLGDGMGPPSVTAGRILAGQLQGKKGEETKLSFDHFPHTGMSRTYNTDNQITDSAASATAYLCGVKTNQGMLGVTARATKGDCSSSENAHVDSILQWAHEAGKSTGVVTTTRITHATPAATYSHTPHRDWEADSDIPEDQSECEDIAKQLVLRNKHINVIMGGGRRNFYPSTLSDTESFDTDVMPMERGDGLNLVESWQEDKVSRNVSHSYVFNKATLDTVDAAKTDYLLGLFSQGHMDYEIDRDPKKATFTSGDDGKSHRNSEER